MKNRYTGRDLRVDVGTIRHGLEGSRTRLLTNARAGTVVGEIIQNAVPVNALMNDDPNVEGTYAMAAYLRDRAREYVAIVTVEQRTEKVNSVEIVDVAHALNARYRKSDRVDTKSRGFIPSTITSISVPDFLSVVKDTHRSILSTDVLQRLGEKKDPDGYYTSSTKFSVYGENPFFDAYMEKMHGSGRQQYAQDHPPKQRQSQTNSTNPMYTPEERQIEGLRPKDLTHTVVPDAGMADMVSKSRSNGAP